METWNNHISTMIHLNRLALKLQQQKAFPLRWEKNGMKIPSKPKLSAWNRIHCWKKKCRSIDCSEMGHNLFFPALNKWKAILFRLENWLINHFWTNFVDSCKVTNKTQTKFAFQLLWQFCQFVGKLNICILYDCILLNNAEFH